MIDGVTGIPTVTNVLQSQSRNRLRGYASLLPDTPPPQDPPMHKLSLLGALRRAFNDTPHFHAGSHADAPEVCFDGACRRPRLTA